MVRLRWRRDRRVSFRRTGGSPPPDWETLDVDADGSFRMWRTVSRADPRPAPVGRFGGAVPAGRLDELRAAAAACERAHPVTADTPPDGATERVAIGPTTASWADDASPEPPWRDLADVLRSLLDELASSPVAAVEVGSGAGRAWLRHVGDGALELDLSGAVVRAVGWDGGVAMAEWAAPVDGPRSVTAAPGWEHELPFAHDHPPGRVVTAHVDGLLAFDGEFWRACAVDGPGPGPG